MAHFFLLNKHSIIFFFSFTSWNLIKISVNYQKVVARPVVLLASVVLNTLKLLYIYSVCGEICQIANRRPYGLIVYTQEQCCLTKVYC